MKPGKGGPFSPKKGGGKGRAKEKNRELLTVPNQNRYALLGIKRGGEGSPFHEKDCRVRSRGV